jgi:hypothetical protein
VWRCAGCRWCDDEDAEPGGASDRQSGEEGGDFGGPRAGQAGIDEGAAGKRAGAGELRVGIARDQNRVRADLCERCGGGRAARRRMGRKGPVEPVDGDAVAGDGHGEQAKTQPEEKPMKRPTRARSPG